MLDYLVVGFGLAGVSFCETLENSGKSFKVISDTSQISSKVAAGLYNPVILKRFSLTWKATDQMELVPPFYKKIEQKLNIDLDQKLCVLRRFASIEEQNLWFEASDKKDMRYYLSSEIILNSNPKIDAPFGFGEVLNTGRINTKSLIENYQDYLQKKNLFVNETFNHSKLHLLSDYVTYNELSARQIVFAEGYGLHKNPYFNYLPLTGTKGELLTIKAPELKETRAIKSSIFIIPIGGDLYRVGATYKWKDKTNLPTEAAKDELLEKLNTFLNCDFTIEDHVAGIRPTVTDRRPLVGRHPEYKNLFLLNGFGSRGVMVGPYASNQLYNLIENNMQIDSEMNIERFKSKYLKG